MVNESSPTYDVFLSYSSKDRIWADAACSVLERHRVRCWIAPRDITPGAEWGAEIVKGIHSSRIMVLIFSSHANTSTQVRREVERAISQGMSVLPVRIENVPPEGAMEYALGNMHWLDAFTLPMERQLELLARSVKTLLGNNDEFVGARAPAQPTAVAGGESPDDSRMGRSLPTSRAVPAPWLILIAASIVGLAALGLIVTARDRGRGEADKTSVPESSRAVVKESKKKGEVKPSETGQGGTASTSNPALPPGESASSPAGQRTALPSDALRPGTFWRGTTTQLGPARSNAARKPRTLWLTIKARTGAQFQAVAESYRGSDEAEGMFKDGVINWRVPKEGSSWEGKLEGDQLVGTYQGTNAYGSFSGAFHLTLADGEHPRALSGRVPLGPLREAIPFGEGAWTVEGEQVIKEGQGYGGLTFGEVEWGDYEFTFEARKLTGPDGFGAVFRKSRLAEGYLLSLALDRKNEYLLNDSHGHTVLGSRRGAIEPMRWYKVRITVLGPSIRIELDDRLLFAVTDASVPRGRVQLRGAGGAVRFRNIRVTAPDRTVLWEGPPDLP